MLLQYLGKRGKFEQKDQAKDCEMTLCDEKSNIQSKSINNEDSERYRSGDSEEENSAAVTKTKITWSRLTIVLDRLLFYLFLLINVIMFTHLFVIVPIMQGYKLPEYRYYG